MKQCICDFRGANLFLGCRCGAMLQERSGETQAHPSASLTFLSSISRIQNTQAQYVFVPILFVGTNAPSMQNMMVQSEDISTHNITNWLPDRDPPPNDLWCNINRSVDSTRLSGIKYFCYGNDSLEEILKVLSFFVKEGVHPDAGWCSPFRFSQLEQCLRLHAHFPQSISLKEIQIPSAMGCITIRPDSTLITDYLYLVTTDTWRFDEVNNIMYCIQPGANGVTY